MIVLGIDPGSRKAGWGVVESSGRTLMPVAWGVIRLDCDESLIPRLLILHQELSEITRRYAPQVAAVEGIFQSGNTRNFQSTLKLGHARGVAVLCVAQQGVQVAEYSPAEVKKALTGNGRAEKAQVREMIRSLLGIREVPAEDAGDALALAVCHAFRAQSPLAGRIR